MSTINRISTLILSAGLLVSSIGIPVSRHYCLNRVKDVKLFVEAKTCNNKSGVDLMTCPVIPRSSNNENGCCKDTRELVKIDNVQDQIVKVELNKLFPVYVPICFAPVLIHATDIFSTEINNFHKPPPIISPSKRVEFHSLLI